MWWTRAISPYDGTWRRAKSARPDRANPVRTQYDGSGAALGSVETGVAVPVYAVATVPPAASQENRLLTFAVTKLHGPVPFRVPASVPVTVSEICRKRVA